MATRAIAATGEVVVNTETYVSSALGVNVQVTLPVINAGAGATVAVDAEIRFETTGAGSIEILTNDGRRVGIVPGYSQAIVVAQAGTVQVVDDTWAFFRSFNSPGAFVIDAPAGGTGATGGAYDTAGHRDSMIACVNAMKAILIDNGLMKAE
jgi:hypothetical protein